MAVFEGKKSSNDIIINDTMSDDEVVASNVPHGTCFTESPPSSVHPSHIYSKKNLKLRVWAKFQTVWGLNYYERLKKKGWPEDVVDLAFGVLGMLPYMR